METEKLQEILKKHKLWLEAGDGGEKANLQNADLRNADLQDANLRYADLRNADLQDADIDFTSWDLSCKSLDVKVCDKISKQLAHHAIAVMSKSQLKRFLKDPIKWANDSHVVSEHDRDKVDDGGDDE